MRLPSVKEEPYGSSRSLAVRARLPGGETCSLRGGPKRTQNRLNHVTQRTPRRLLGLDQHWDCCLVTLARGRQAAWRHANSCSPKPLAWLHATQTQPYSWGKNETLTQVLGTRILGTRNLVWTPNATHHAVGNAAPRKTTQTQLWTTRRDLAELVPGTTRDAARLNSKHATPQPTS